MQTKLTTQTVERTITEETQTLTLTLSRDEAYRLSVLLTCSSTLLDASLLRDLRVALLALPNHPAPSSWWAAVEAEPGYYRKP